jgi:hypothetical protein
MLNPTQHIFVIYWAWVQIIKVLDLISMLKMLVTICCVMISNNYKFLAFMFCEFTFQYHLFFRKFKGLTNSKFRIYTR